MDGLGSVRQLYDSAGEVIADTRYDPYGNIISQSGAATSAYGFTGEWQDDTGLTYLRARYYDSYLNQMIQPDPIVPDYENPQTLNRYTYALNNPVRYAGSSIAPPIGWPADVILNNSAFTINPQPQFAIRTVIHELGHVWDFRTGGALSQGLMNRLQTWVCKPGNQHKVCSWNPYANGEVPAGARNGCTVNQIAQKVPGCDIPYAFTYGDAGPQFEGAGWEDWADSFAAYIYRAYNQAAGLTNLVLGGIRETYVREQIDQVH